MIRQLKIKLLKRFLPWILGIIYVISPIDIIPDLIGGLGWLDDISVLGIMIWWFLSMQKKQGRTSSSKSGNREKEGEAKKEENTGEEESDPFKILGVERGASRDEIKTAYNRLAAQYHPDKVQHLGEEFRELAHRKFVAIQRAYDELVK